MDYIISDEEFNSLEWEPVEPLELSKLVSNCVIIGAESCIDAWSGEKPEIGAVFFFLMDMTRTNSADLKIIKIEAEEIGELARDLIFKDVPYLSSSLRISVAYSTL